MADGAFSLLQDCTHPPCCPHLLEEFAGEHRNAAIFGAATVAGRSAPPAVVAVLATKVVLRAVSNQRDESEPKAAIAPPVADGASAAQPEMRVRVSERVWVK